MRKLFSLHEFKKKKSEQFTSRVSIAYSPLLAASFPQSSDSTIFIFYERVHFIITNKKFYHFSQRQHNGFAYGKEFYDSIGLNSRMESKNESIQAGKKSQLLGFCIHNVFRGRNDWRNLAVVLHWTQNTESYTSEHAGYTKIDRWSSSWRFIA